MGNLGLIEILLVIPGCLIGALCIAGAILGTLAFFKVRRLEKGLKERRP